MRLSELVTLNWFLENNWFINRSDREHFMDIKRDIIFFDENQIRKANKSSKK